MIAQNEATADRIYTVDPNFLTSKQPKCAVEGGHVPGHWLQEAYWE